MAQASALLKARVRRPSYLNKLRKPEDLIDYFPNGSYIGWSGFTGVGFVLRARYCAEMLTNVQVSKVGRPSCADFLNY